MILPSNLTRAILKTVALLLFITQGSSSLAQAANSENLSTEYFISELSEQGLNFADIGVINGLPTFVAPGEGSSVQVQGPPETLTALTLRWNGRYAKADETRDYFVDLLGTLIPQINNDFFFQLQLRSSHEISAGNTKISGNYRKLGNQVSWTIEARFDEQD